MKEKKRKNRSMTLRSKLLLIFGITWFVAIAAISTVAVVEQFEHDKSYAIQENMETLFDMRQECDAYVEKMDMIGINCAYNPYIREICSENFIRREESEQTEILNKAARLISDDAFVAAFNHPGSLKLITSDRRFYSNFYTTIQPYEEDMELILNLERIPRFGFELIPMPEDGSMLYIRRVRTANPDSGFGALILRLRVSEFEKICEEFFPRSEWVLSHKNGTILACNDPAAIGENTMDRYGADLMSKGPSTRKVSEHRRKGYISSIRNGNMELCYSRFTPSSEIFSKSEEIIVTVVIIAVAAMLILLYLSYYLSRRLVRPLHKLEGLMEQVEEGDLTVRMNPQYNDEVACLGRHFDQMIIKTEELMNNIQSIEEEKRNDELKILQLQLNPHFLYNTLSSIIWLANENQMEDVIDLTKSLAIFYRLAISLGKEEVSVRDEVANAKNYIRIQQYRYRDEFKIEYDIDEDVLQYTTLKLVLQPLIENAIYHGVKSREGKDAVIVLKGYTQGCTLCLEVQDNGIGITEEEIKDMNKALKDNTAAGVGTSNVHRRIFLYYGENYGLSFARNEGWTIARIQLPIKLWEETDGV